MEFSNIDFVYPSRTSIQVRTEIIFVVVIVVVVVVDDDDDVFLVHNGDDAVAVVVVAPFIIVVVVEVVRSTSTFIVPLPPLPTLFMSYTLHCIVPGNI